MTELSPMTKLMLFEQLVIVLIKRAIEADNLDALELPVVDVDNTGQDLLTMQVVERPNGPVFRFEVSKKS